MKGKTEGPAIFLFEEYTPLGAKTHGVLRLLPLGEHPPLAAAPLRITGICYCIFRLGGYV